MALRRVVLLFPTTHAVMHASQLLEDAGVEHKVVPRPRGINADCGIAVALAPALGQQARRALAEGNCEPSRVLDLEKPDRGEAVREGDAHDGGSQAS